MSRELSFCDRIRVQVSAFFVTPPYNFPTPLLKVIVVGLRSFDGNGNRFWLNVLPLAEANVLIEARHIEFQIQRDVATDKRLFEQREI